MTQLNYIKRGRQREISSMNPYLFIESSQVFYTLIRFNILTCPHDSTLTHARLPRIVTKHSIKRIKPRFISFFWVFCWFYGSSHPAGESSLCPEFALKDPTAELLWRSAAIIPQVPTLFSAWIRAPESTNRWLLVHERHVTSECWQRKAAALMWSKLGLSQVVNSWWAIFKIMLLYFHKVVQ